MQTSPSDVLELILLIGALVAALSGIVGLLWWLVAPRIVSAVEGACHDALGDVVENHDERLERLEDALARITHPTALVELSDLLAMVERHHPPPPVAPYRPPRPQRS